MKKLLFALATLLCFVGCEYDDTSIWEELKKHDERITKLETLCNQMNTNISSLQAIVAALQNNDYVTAVAPITNNGTTIGYTISFSKSQPVTIYHGKDGANGKDGINGKDGVDGKDGKDGVNGKDGHTPQIGVKKDADDIYYWTIDGEWLLDEDGNKIKAVGVDGKDGQNGKDGINGTDGKDGKDGKEGEDGINGADGKDGKDGEDGADGKDGITPRLKIENGYWYISYDDGATWTELYKAVGEDEDSFFTSVTQDDDNLYLTLVDGSVITIKKQKESEVEDLRIYYSTNDKKPVDFYPLNWGATFESNVYDAETGKGYLEFDGVSNTIPMVAFENCTNLTEIVIHPGILYINDSAFSGCSNLSKVTLPEYGKTIGSRSFYQCTSLSSITIPDRVTTIADRAFYKCDSLTSVTIGNSVTEIGNYALMCRNLKEVYYQGDLSGWCKISFATLSANPLYNGAKLYIDNKEVTDITIPSDITSIGNSTFEGCSSLTSVTIPDSVTEIGDYAFRNCSSLTSVTIPDSVTTIGSSAFKDCSSLTSVTIPDSVTEIGMYAFSGCSSLTSITIGNRVTEIGEQAFCNCSSLTSVTIPNSVTTIGKYAFYDCSSLKSVYCKPTTPPQGGSSMFSDNATDRKIYVPASDDDSIINAYKAADGWKKYADYIEEYEF